VSPFEETTGTVPKPKGIEELAVGVVQIGPGTQVVELIWYFCKGVSFATEYRFWSQKAAVL
jgi:hypothetical protein